VIEEDEKGEDLITPRAAVYKEDSDDPELMMLKQSNPNYKQGLKVPGPKILFADAVTMPKKKKVGKKDQLAEE
jgi:hypothetical protein